MALPRYSESASCPKCGAADAATRHCRDSEGFCGGVMKRTCNGSGQEHMHRTCRHCDYSWGEAPLDAVPEER